MTEIIILVSALITNAVVALFKPSRKDTFTPTQLEKRKVILRVFSAVVALVSSVVTAMLLGEPLDDGAINGNIEIILTAAVSWLTSQATYLLTKKKKS